ncbi:hypothetical protein ACNOYE_18340 [Nannocystaceae bacterium ST9]
MAMIFTVEYPGGERVWAIGYPGAPLRVGEVPRGPEACYADELEVEFVASSEVSQVHRVVRILGGPRRASVHVRLAGAGAAERETWMDAREREGWLTREAPGDPETLWVAPTRAGMDTDALICLAREFRASLRPT